MHIDEGISISWFFNHRLLDGDETVAMITQAAEKADLVHIEVVHGKSGSRMVLK